LFTDKKTMPDKTTE